MTFRQLEQALQAVGDLLEAEHLHEAIIVVGGVALNMLGLLQRTTQDVDIIARGIAPTSELETALQLLNPDPLPDGLVRAIATVARDFGLPPDWMNTEVAMQWRFGLPPSIKEDLTWRRFGGLSIGLAGRRTIIALKLFAAVDQGPNSVHFQDLIALSPSSDELADAARWVYTQDASEDFPRLVDEVVQSLTEH